MDKNRVFREYKMRDRRRWVKDYRYCLLLGLSATLSFTPVVVNAQLVPDNTLGKENSVVTPVNSLQKQIDGGAIRGSNLFHSFQEFNVDSGGRVYFSNPSAIENILTRVTGGNPSAILGRLGVQGNANLFLINPSGIIFGENASLDISGSFTATTAESFRFPDGSEFSAVNPGAKPLLKISVNPGVQYPAKVIGDISSGGKLTVGKDLNLVGNNLNLTGELGAGGNLSLQAENNLTIRDNINNPFIASAGGSLLLQGNQSIDIFALNHPDSGLFSGKDLLLRSTNPVLGDAHYFSGGSFKIEQLNGNLGDLESPNDPIIRASGDVSFDSYRGNSLHILAGGSVNITGDVTITGADSENGLEETVTLSNGESLEVNGKTQATLDIRAGTTGFGISGITGDANLQPNQPNTGGIGSSSDIVLGGNITVEEENGLVLITNQYSPDVSLSGGNIQIQGNINTSSNSGNAGEIIVDALGNLEISSEIQANSSIGASGTISLSSGGTLSMFNEANVESRSNTNDFEANLVQDLVFGGDIKLTAPSIVLQDASRVTVGISGLGTGGDLIVETQELKIFDGSGLDSITRGIGDAGNINITTQNLLIQNSLSEPDSITIKNINDFRTGINTFVSRLPENSSFNSDYSQSGQGGSITINASDSVELIGNKPGAFSPTLEQELIGSIQLDTGIISETTGTGAAGDININTNELKIKNGAAISTSSISPASLSTMFPDLVPSLVDNIAPELQSNLITQINENLSNILDAGNSGELNINSHNIEFQGEAGLTTATLSSGEAGDLTINNTGELILKDGAIIAASTLSTGNAGDLQITTDKLSVRNGSLITVGTTNQGQGGDLTIFAADLVELMGVSGDGKAFSKLSATAEGESTGNAGELKVETKKLIITDGAQISASTVSTQGGEITLQGLDTLELDKGEISASTVDGEAGDVFINAAQSIKLLNNSAITSEATGEGTAGFLSITTKDLDIIDSSRASVNSQQTAGDLFVTADNITLSDEAKITAETTNGVSGHITLQNLQTLQLSGSSLISATTVDGEAGDITIHAKERVTVETDSKITSGAIDQGEAGFLKIITDQLKISDRAQLSVSNQNGEVPGFIFIQGSDVSLSNQGEISAKTNFGTSGDINLENLTTLQLSGDSSISANTNDGQAGNITVDATDSIQIENNSKILSEALGNGIAGNITINTNQFQIANNSQANVSSKGNGSAGSILVDARDVNLTDQAQIAAQTTESGTDGNITFNNLNSLKLSDSKISASTTNGEAGDIDINATDSVELFENSKIASEAKGNGIAGELTINTNQFTITGNSQATVSSTGDGNAGSVLIEADDVNLSNQGRISANTSNGISGDITFKNINSLFLNNNASISASTINGEAGDISINANHQVNIVGDSKLASTATGNGTAGFLEIITEQLNISDRSEATVSSKGDGNAGYISIQAKDVSLTNQVKISATTESGIGGDITISGLNSLFVGNSEISAPTIDGQAGNLSINATDSVTLTGEGGLSVQASNGGTAGSVELNTSDLRITDGATVTVSSKSGQAGDLDITADDLYLNQGKLTAETGVGEGSDGANINLSVKNLLRMDDNSLISAEAFNTANGGNITINNPNGFVIGLEFENNDITANATGGNGGNIDITTQSIFGLEFREKRTPKSDITASSKFGLNGQVIVDQLNVDPAFALMELSSNLVEKNQIKNGCAASVGNNFTVSGRGGLPSSPNDLFNGNRNLVELVDLVPGDSQGESSPDVNISSNISSDISPDISSENNNTSVRNQNNQLVEAQGWIIDAQGNIKLVAQVPKVEPQDSSLNSASCNSFSSVEK